MPWATSACRVVSLVAAFPQIQRFLPRLFDALECSKRSTSWSTPTTRHTAARSIRCSAAANAATPLARDVFHGHRGQLRRHYQVGQENQLDSLGIMASGTPCTRRPPSITCVPTDTSPTPPGLHRSDTPASTSTAATAPPATHQPPASDRYAPTDSGSCTNPRHGPSPLAVEGTVNRIKQLKAAMYGRAKPDLLRKLIL